jgi:diacylglycerol O-acyltransferase / wax synthase
MQHSLASTIESLGLGALPMLANAVISNPAGFEQRMYFNGAEVELALPISVVAHHQVLNITITTYVDRLHVTFIALKEAIPDLHRLAEFTAAAVAELEADLARAPRRKTRLAGRKAPAKSAKPRRRVAGGRAFAASQPRALTSAGIPRTEARRPLGQIRGTSHTS